VETAVAAGQLVLHSVLLVACIVLWIVAPRRGWLDDVTFVSHLSLAALVLATLSGVAAALAAMFGAN
jgi:hypothetical protein